MEAVSFEDYINRLKAQNIIIETGNSKKYGTVTKYRFSVEQRFHRGYSLGSFYTDDNIKKRISRRQDYLKTQKKKAEERKEKRKAAYDAMSPGEKNWIKVDFVKPICQNSRKRENMFPLRPFYLTFSWQGIKKNINLFPQKSPQRMFILESIH